jgi:hypothetical protein
MKTPSAQEIKSAIKELSTAESLELILRLARFKKENKELLTYLLFNASDESGFIEDSSSFSSITFMSSLISLIF